MKYSKIYNSILVIAALAATTACSDSKNGDDPSTVDDGSVAVSITTTVTTKANVVTDLTSGAKMNIFAKTYGRVDAPNMVDGVVAVNNGGTWTFTPEVRIKSGQNAFLYAVSPYDASYTDAAKIPVDITKQVDLLYSGEYVPASYNTHVVKVTMKHALSLVSLNIASQGYSGTGTLTSVSITGDNVYTKGTMDVSTGKITGTGKDQATVSYSKNITSSGWKSDLPGYWVIPFNNKSQAASLTAVIDGKTYVVPMPEVEMRTGFQYIFRLVLTNNGLAFIPSQTESVSLNVSSDEMEEMVGYGLINFTFTGTEFTFPYFTGDNVYGTIISGTNSASYSIGGKMTLTATGSKTVSVETWNSTGFEISSLENIDGIDISAY
jgi:hypothetical protein